MSQTNNPWKNVTIVTPSSDKNKITNTNKKNRIMKEGTNEEILWLYLQEDFELRGTIEYHLNESGKISAIKYLREYVEDKEVPEEMSPGEKCSLRELKDVIDKYAKRYTITKKVKLLRKRIEKWARINGFENISKQKEVKDKLTGDYVYMYTDWEMVDDHYGLMINDWGWLPAPKTMKLYNTLWKQYSYVDSFYEHKTGYNKKD